MPTRKKARVTKDSAAAAAATSAAAENSTETSAHDVTTPRRKTRNSGNGTPGSDSAKDAKKGEKKGAKEDLKDAKESAKDGAQSFPEARIVQRVPQPCPLPPVTPIVSVKTYLYSWEGQEVVVQRLAEAGDYSYVHILLQDKSEHRLDHWVETAVLTARPRTRVEVKGAAAPPETQSQARVRRVDHIVFGELIIPAWYEAPFPHSLDVDLRANGGRLYVCEVCLKYTTDRAAFSTHFAKDGLCTGDLRLRHPPGCEVYSSMGWSVWDVDGSNRGLLPVLTEAAGESVAAETQLRAAAGKERYCQTLTLLCRLFLGNKLNRYGASPFRFFVLTEHVGNRHCFRGMFSREKGHPRNNLSCIVVLPPWQRSGWGKRLVHLSYLLTRTEGGAGTPECPLSALGTQMYETYHEGQVLDYLRAKLPELKGMSVTKVVDALVRNTGIDRPWIQDAVGRLSSASGVTSADLDWEALVDPRLNSSSSRPELELDASSVFHMSISELMKEPSVAI